MFGLIPYTHNITRRNDRDFLNPFSDDFMREFFGTISNVGFRVDVRDEGDHYTMEAELPGVKKEDVKVSVENGVMTITATTNTEGQHNNDNYVYRERRYGSMQRAFSLEGIREDEIAGEYKDGVLTLNLPKLTENVPAKREITIA